MKRIKLIVIMIYLLLNLQYLSAAFESMYTTSEAVKTADACCAKIMGVSSMYYNAAGLAGMDKKELNIQYSRMLLKLDNDSLDYFNLMFGCPFKTVKLGLSYNKFSSELYSEQIFSLSLAGDMFKTFYKNIAAGLRVKLLKIGYEENDYTKMDKLFINYRYSQSALSIDFGILGYSKKGFSYGIALKDINSPDMTLENSGHTIPLSLKIGTAYKLVFKKLLYAMDEINFSLDMNYKRKDYSFHLGIEPVFLNYILIPGIGFAIGNKDFRYFTTGLSYQLPLERVSSKFKDIDYLFKFNYSFKFHLGGMSRGTYGDHFISVGFMF